MTSWHESDELWEALGPSLFPPGMWDQAEEELDLLLALTGVTPGARVLDMACGPGRHALELVARGYDVVGVDRTLSYLERGRREAAAHGLSVAMILGDMRTFRQPGAFDLVLNLYHSFGYFEDPDEDRAALVNMGTSLRPGGKLVLALMGREVLARTWQSRDWQRAAGGGYMLQDRHISNDWTWMDVTWTLIRDGQVKTYKYSHRVYGARELSDLVLDCGFSEAKVYGDFSGAPYDHTARGLVVVATR